MASVGLDTNRSQFFLTFPKTSPLGDIFLMTPGHQPWDDMFLRPHPWGGMLACPPCPPGPHPWSGMSPKTLAIAWHVPQGARTLGPCPAGTGILVMANVGLDTNGSK